MEDTRIAYALVLALSLFLLALVALPLGAPAQTTCQQIGQFRYCNNAQNGYNSTQQQLGQFTYQNGTYRDQNGATRTFSQTCQRIGQFTYCN